MLTSYAYDWWVCREMHAEAMRKAALYGSQPLRQGENLPAVLCLLTGRSQLAVQLAKHAFQAGPAAYLTAAGVHYRLVCDSLPRLLEGPEPVPADIYSQPTIYRATMQERCSDAAIRSLFAGTSQLHQPFICLTGCDAAGCPLPHTLIDCSQPEGLLKRMAASFVRRIQLRSQIDSTFGLLSKLCE